MEYNYEQLQARIITARELRSRALGDFIAGQVRAAARPLRRGAGWLREFLASLGQRRSHS